MKIDSMSLGVSDPPKRKCSDDELTDEEIIGRVVSGEKQLFRLLVSRNKDKIFSLIMRQIGDREVSEDLTQETLIKAYRNLKSFRAESQFSTWLVRIAINTTNSYFASRKFKEQKQTEAFDTDTYQTQSSSPEQIHEEKQRMLRFRSCFSKLKPKLREVVSLCALEGKSYEESAVILDVPIGTVRSRLNTARLELKTCMQAVLGGSKK